MARPNKLAVAERYIRRKVLAELIGTNATYISVLSGDNKLTPEMEERVQKAVRRVIKNLEKIV